MTNENLKGWLVLPEGMVQANLITSIKALSLPTPEEIKLLPGIEKCRNQAVVSCGDKSVLATDMTYAEVKALFEKALAESANVKSHKDLLINVLWGIASGEKPSYKNLIVGCKDFEDFKARVIKCHGDALKQN